MENLLNIFLMAPAKEGQNPLMSFLPLILIVVVIYLFMIRPQMRKQKELRTFRESLKKGDKIVTTGGIYGKISELSEQTVTVEIAEKVKIKIDKAAVLKDPSDISTQQK